jgi:hyperosmotically inducible protein
MKKSSISTSVKTGSIVAAVALMLTLGACSKNDENKTAGQKLDGAIAATEQKATEIKAEVKDAAVQARDQSKTAMAEVTADVKDATASAKASGEKTAATLGDKLDDAAITASVKTGLAKDTDLSAIKIEVDTKNGVVSLMGPAPSSAAKDRATEIAKSVKGVTSVSNKLAVKAG